MANDPASETSAREIVSSRLIEAPREQIFEAFSDPARLARWWGPKGFTNTFREFEFRPGGHWRFTMHGPDGTDYPNHSVFDEVVRPERIVFRHLDEMHEFQMTIFFTEQDGKTRITWRMRHPTVEKCERVKPFVVEANEQNLDKLAGEVAKMMAARGGASR